MLETREILKRMNPELFSTTQVAQPYACVISVAKKVKGADGETDQYKFVQTSDRQIPGIKGKSLYLRASFKKAGEKVKTLLQNGEERTAFRGSKRSTPGNIFKNQQPNLFNFMVEELKLGDKGYKEVGKDSDGNVIVETNALVYGKRIAVNVPTYTPMSTDEDGKRKKLTGTKYDPKTDSYIENAPVTMDVFRFFADEDDLEELLGVATKLVDRQVMPYVTKSRTVIEEDLATGTVTQKKEEADLSSDDEIATATQPNVDDDDDDDPDADV